MYRAYTYAPVLLLTLACGPNGGTSSDTGSTATTTDTTDATTTTPTTADSTTAEPTTADSTTADSTTTDPTESAANGCERVTGSGDVAWALRCGGPSREDVRNVSVDAAGNIYVGIETRGLDPGDGPGEPFRIGEFEITPGEVADILLVKLDSEGEALWVKHFTGPDHQNLGTLHACGDGVVITGSAPPGTLDFGGGPIADENFIVSLDSDGEQRWSRGWQILTENGYIAVLDVACDADLGVVLTGWIDGDVDLGGGPILAPNLDDGIIARYDAKGALLWSRSFGGTKGSNPKGRGLAHAPGGAIVMIGSFSATIDLGGGPLTAENGDDVVVAKLDAAGEHVWSQKIGPEGLQYGSSIAVDASGKLAIGGTFLEGITLGADSYVNTFPDAEPDIHGTVYDGFLAFLDDAGTLQSSLQIGSMLDDEVYDLRFDANGTLLLSALTKESFVVQAFVDGEPGWKWSTNAFLRASTAATADAVVLGASVGPEIDLGGGSLSARGNEDMVVVKLRR